MKRALAVAMAFLCLMMGMNAFAGDYGSTRFGIYGGITSSNGKASEFSTKDVSLYHIGAVLQIPLPASFSVQPGLIYQMKGMELDEVSGTSASDVLNSLETKVGYLELPVQVQWGLDLGLLRPYAFAEPFVGYRLKNSSKGSLSSETLDDCLKKVDYGLGVGAGIDIWQFQVSAKWFWNFGGIYQTDASKTSQTISNIKDGNNFNGFALSLAIMF